MSNQDQNTNQRLWVGILVICIGVLFLLDTLNVINFSFIFNWWPVILLVIGYMKWNKQERNSAILFFTLGIIFLATSLNIISIGKIFQLWPLALIAVGIFLIFKSGDTSRNILKDSKKSTTEFLTASAIFGGTERTVTSDPFKGGDIMALFGGVDLDLRQAKFDPDGCTLSLTAIFGGVELRVPQNCSTIITGTPIFGGIEDKTVTIESETNSTRLHCKCTVLFGGVDIKN